MKSFDHYRARLKHALWTWRENHRWHQGKKPKDRQSGRADKRSARQSVAREIDEEKSKS